MAVVIGLSDGSNLTSEGEADDFVDKIVGKTELFPVTGLGGAAYLLNPLHVVYLRTVAD